MARYIHNLIQRMASWFAGSFGINMPKQADYTFVLCREQKSVSDHDRYKHSLMQRQYPQV